MPAEADLYAVPVARNAIAVIIHPRNTVHDLTLSQIREIFSGKITNWGELGGVPRPIILVTREEGSGTREAFQKLVMGKNEINLGALVQDSNGAIRQVVSNDQNAIGYISLGLVNKGVKALKVKEVEATVANIENGSYTLVRPFIFAFNGTPTGEAKAFLSAPKPAAQKLLAKEGLVPIKQ